MRTIFIGFILVKANYSSQKSNVAWLTYIFINYDYQKKRIASTLIESAISKLKKQGKNDLIAEVYENTAESLEFFVRKNFKKKESWFILYEDLVYNLSLICFCVRNHP